MSEEVLSKFEARHKAFPGFVVWLRQNSAVRIRDRTVAHYLKQLDTMSRIYGLKLDAVPNAKSVMAKMQDAEIAQSTLNLRAHVLRYWLRYRGIEVTEDLRTLLKKKRANRKRKLHSHDLLTLEEVCDIAQNTPSKALGAYVLSLWDCGCRPNELAQLTVADVQQDQHGFRFTFRETKNEPSRRGTRLIEPKSRARFRRWWADHPRRDDPSAPVFINQRGGFFKTDSILNLLKKRHQERLGRGQKNGKAPLSLYLFRFSRATQLMRDKVLSENEIRTRMGHEAGSKILEKVYGILNAEDQERAELRAAGVIVEESQRPRPIICPECSEPNDPGSASCQLCHLPLTEKEMIRQQKISLETLATSDVLRATMREVLLEELGRSDEEQA